MTRFTTFAREKGSDSPVASFSAVLALFWAAIACTVACGEREQPNILLVISDDQSYTHTSLDRNENLVTPNLERLAEQGVRFTNAFCASPSCSPSRAALLTGKQIWQIGSAASLFGPLHPKHKTYPELLWEDGYQVGYTGKGWGPGPWKEYGRSMNPAGIEYNVHGERCPENFKDFLDSRDEDKPFCFWLGSKDPHRPFEEGLSSLREEKLDSIELPPSWPDLDEQKREVVEYYAEIERFDRHLGEVVAELKERDLLANTLIVVTSDNGWDFPRGKSTLYDYGTRMPFVAAWPARIPPGRCVDDFVSLIDLAPTFLAAAGLAQSDMEGRNLLGLLLSEEEGRLDADRRFVVFGKERHAPYRPGALGYPSRALRTEDFLLIRNFAPERWPQGAPPEYDDPTGQTITKRWVIDHLDTARGMWHFDLLYGKRPEYELYDLKNDPEQLDNVAYAEAYAAIFEELKGELNRYLEATGDPRVTEAEVLWDQQKDLRPRWNHPEFLPAEGEQTLEMF